jgi:hypothetical protein
MDGYAGGNAQATEIATCLDIWAGLKGFSAQIGNL